MRLRVLIVCVCCFSLLSWSAAAQCPGDPTSGNPATRQLILSLGQAIPSTAPDAMQQMATALQARGHAVVVMDNNGPSDHKAWIDGDAWTWRSTDAVRCPTITWSPYLQTAYDGSGISKCGIPTSAHLTCPSWFVAATPPSGPMPPPVVVPPSGPTDDPRFEVLKGQIAFVREGLAQLTVRVQRLEAHPIYASCSASINLGMKIPISCKLTQ